MNQLLLIIDSVLFAVKPTVEQPKGLIDPTVYVVITHRQTYCGQIIFQDDTMMKFRTSNLKPVKILKSNIREISILKQATIG